MGAPSSGAWIPQLTTIVVLVVSYNFFYVSHMRGVGGVWAVLVFFQATFFPNSWATSHGQECMVWCIVKGDMGKAGLGGREVGKAAEA